MHTLKVLGTTALLLVLIIGSGMLTHRSIERSSQGLQAHIDRIDAGAKSEDWQMVNSQLYHLRKKWQQTEKFWAMVIDHAEIDSISMALSRLENYAASGNKALVMGEVANLKKTISHIPEKEAFKLKNIF